MNTRDAGGPADGRDDLRLVTIERDQYKQLYEAHYEGMEALGNDIRRLETTNAELHSRLAALERGLQSISAMRGKCIYSHEEEFRAGSNVAFDQCASIADATLQAVPPEGRQE